ncbi:hypothetical protein [Sphingomonas sp.]|uniref:hypothetical protein n=1 Tax=Sphingomonas sp. TaxID=28214 RepID=UPI002BE22977|nr:hypothetical protein [Sphingomonas sp.]HWK35096.1 hypothetical protein [Sphingomonas sp.]
MICAGVMLATVLFWPIVFGGGGNPAAAAPPASHRQAAAVTMLVPPSATPLTAPPAATRLVRPPVSGTPGSVTMVVPAPRPFASETCTHRFSRAAPVCTTGQCRARAIDALDICEGTGFWPD